MIEFYEVRGIMGIRKLIDLIVLDNPVTLIY